MSMFDPATFLDTPVTEANSTEVTPIPEGTYLAVIIKAEARVWTSKADPTSTGVVVDVTYELADTALEEEFQGRTVKQGIMLDLTDSGTLDFGKGKNVSLGRLRESLKLNTPGETFAFSQLPGRLLKVFVKHRLYQDTIFSEVKGTAPASE